MNGFSQFFLIETHLTDGQSNSENNENMHSWSINNIKIGGLKC